MDIMNLISNMGTIANTAGEFLGALNEAKDLMESGRADAAAFAAPMAAMPAMAPFTPQMQDPYGGGQQWLGQLQQVAADNGNAWVPPQTAGLGGIDLTGVWSPPMNPMSQTYIRQFGPYLNIIEGIGGMPTAMGEGLFDPQSSTLRVVGRDANGSPVQAQAQLMPNWMMQGVTTILNPWGMPMNGPFVLQRVA